MVLFANHVCLTWGMFIIAEQELRLHTGHLKVHAAD